jgi:hypothetical protein
MQRQIHESETQLPHLRIGRAERLGAFHLAE